jgi:nitrate reductase gamma subunit
MIDPMCAGVQTKSFSLCSNQDSNQPTENLMYFGGILGTILIIALIVYFVRRV